MFPRNTVCRQRFPDICVGRACTEGIRLYTARMMGEAPDPKLVAGANQIASEAVQAIAGSLIEGKLVYKDFAIALDEAGKREGLKEALLRKQGLLSLDEKRWFDDLKKLNEEQKDLPIQGREPDIAAFLILDALLKMNWVCELALAYPKHKDLHRTAMAMLGTNGVVLDFIFDAEHAKLPIFDATPSVELYRSFPSISAFYDRVLGG